MIQRLTIFKNYPYLLYLVILLFVLLFILSTGFNGLYGQDGHEYLRYTERLIHFFKTGQNPGDYFWPLYYPLLGALFSVLFNPIFSLQLISVFSMILSFFYLERILLLLFSDEPNIIRKYLILFFVLCPFVLRASVVVMSDMLCLFFIVASVYHFLKYLKEQKNNQLMVMIVFSVSAMMTRYAAIIVLLIPIFYAGILFIRKVDFKTIFLIFLITIILITPHVFVKTDHPTAFLHHTWLQRWSLEHFFSLNFNTEEGNYHYSFPNFLYVFFHFIHPGFLFPGFALLFAIRKKDFAERDIKILLLLTIVYALFLCGIPFQNLRFLLLTFPFVLILLFPAFMRIYKQFSTNHIRMKIILIAIVVIQLSLFIRAFHPFYKLNVLEKEIAGRILKYPSKTIYTFSIDGALKSYGVNNKLINMWDTKINEPELKSLILFNESAFAEEYKSKSPMLNWQFIKEKYHLQKKESLREGWELYEIQ